MKFIVSVLVIALLSLAVGLFFPWWTIAIVAFIVTSLIPQNPLRSFLSGFTALFLLWGALAWLISSNNEHLMASKVALILKMGNSTILILATAIIGALVAGFAALAGSFVRKK
ncbi:MAG: hypothetical protein EBZ95_07700 [Chitinophagia bacterium]|nr:hypothetical protein [Chitinophagia bacterium]